MTRRVRRGLFVAIAAVAAIALALGIAQDQETLQLRSALAAADAGSAAYLAALSGAPVTHGNTFKILNNGDEVFPAMLAAIAQARTRVSFETYVFEDGAVAQQFIAAFIAAATRGVTVNIIVDFLGGSGMSDADVKKLRDAGCHVSSYNSAQWYGLEEVNYRTHRKILVVDGETGFTGGIGIADHWLGHAESPERWRDVQVEMHGPVARLLEAAFYENFVEDSGPITPILNPPAAAAEPHGAVGEGAAASGGDDGGSGAATLIVRSSASGGSSDMKRLYLLLMASARQRLDIGSPYFVSDESSEWVLDDAARRGVRVRILTEGDRTDARPVKYSSRRSYERLLSKGIEIYEYQPTMFHTKMMVVDGVWSMFGSANFDNRSLELNDELNIAVQDEELAMRFSRVFEADLTRARRLDLESWTRRPLGEKAREHFWGYWGEIF
jgi:cardiolipin synthase A/B